MGDSIVETISRLALWRIDNFGPCSYKKSDPFKIGIWNWHLSVEKNRYLCIRLFPEASRVSKKQPPIARFIIRVSNSGPNRRSYISPELMLLGFISLLLTASSSLIANICIPSKFYDSNFAPCSRSQIDQEIEQNSSEERKLLMLPTYTHVLRRRLNNFERNTCKEACHLLCIILFKIFFGFHLCSKMEFEYKISYLHVNLVVS